MSPRRLSRCGQRNPTTLSAQPGTLHGGERLELTVSDADRLDEAVGVVTPLGVAPAVTDVHRRSLTMPVTGGVKALRQALDQFEAVGLEVDDAGVRRPTLDDVFLTLTGSTAGDDEASGEAAS